MLYATSEILGEIRPQHNRLHSDQGRQYIHNIHQFCKQVTKALIRPCECADHIGPSFPALFPASILYKSIAGRYRPVSYPDGVTARYRFIKNANWVAGLCRTGHFRTVPLSSITECIKLVYRTKAIVTR